MSNGLLIDDDWAKIDVTETIIEPIRILGFVSQTVYNNIVVQLFNLIYGILLLRIPEMFGSSVLTVFQYFCDFALVLLVLIGIIVLFLYIGGMGTKKTEDTPLWTAKTDAFKFLSKLTKIENNYDNQSILYKLYKQIIQYFIKYPYLDSYEENDTNNRDIEEVGRCNNINNIDSKDDKDYCITQLKKKKIKWDDEIIIDYKLFPNPEDNNNYYYVPNCIKTPIFNKETIKECDESRKKISYSCMYDAKVDYRGAGRGGGRRGIL